MGNDFKRKTAEPFQRGRRQQVEDLSEPELPMKPVDRIRSFVILPTADAGINDSENCDVVIDGASLKVLKNEKIVGVTQTAPASVMEDIGNAGGRVPGRMLQYHGPNMPCRVSVQLPKSPSA